MTIFSYSKTCIFCGFHELLIAIHSLTLEFPHFTCQSFVPLLVLGLAFSVSLALLFLHFAHSPKFCLQHLSSGSRLSVQLKPLTRRSRLHLSSQPSSRVEDLHFCLFPGGLQTTLVLALKINVCAFSTLLVGLIPGPSGVPSPLEGTFMVTVTGGYSLSLVGRSP